ncbi:MAG: GGDEF domain-containing protein [Blautia sp.]|nr:GGDEF domain-containing protein [Blautia sp.]
MYEKEGVLRKGIHTGYLVLLAGMLLILTLIVLTRGSDNLIRFEEQYQNIDGAWTLDEEGSRSAELSRLGSYMEADAGQLSIYYRLSAVTDNTSLIYRTKDVYTRVLLDGEPIYETRVPDSSFYNRSPGNLWNMVNLPATASGKVVEVQIIPAYDANAVVMDSTCLGSATAVITHLLRSKAGAIFISLLMVLIGLIMIVVNLITQRNIKDRNFGDSFLGIYAVITGFWSLLETNVVQLLIRDMRIIQTADNMVMIVGIMPLLIYLDYEYHILDYMITRCICIVDMGYILFCVVMQISGFRDFHSFLAVSQLFTTVGSVTVLAWVIKECRQQWKEFHRIKPGLVLKLAGISSLMLISIVIVYQYTKEDVADRAQWMRLGMFVFIICFCAGSLMRTYRFIANGLRYDIVKNLAYQDGLTLLGNRTAYLEQLDRYAQENLPLLGIVFMDINNLKMVNDCFGHDEGDVLIKAAAEIIRDSFGQVGKTYRIGGDEFCALIEDQEPDKVYREALETFQRRIGEANKKRGDKIRIQIAQGFALCENATMEKLEAAVSAADHAMYVDKARQKGAV